MGIWKFSRWLFFGICFSSLAQVVSLPLTPATQEPTGQGTPAQTEPEPSSQVPSSEQALPEHSSLQVETEYPTGGPLPLDPGLSVRSMETSLPPVVDYDIQVRLDPETKTITGIVRLVYTNHAPDIIPDLYFHTYLNAFKNNLSTYMLESRNTAGMANEKRGYSHIRSAMVNGEDLSASMAYVQGPVSAAGDQTVLRIPLTGPLMPGESVTVELDFQAKLPRAFERTGYSGDFFFLAQWFPKIGVWETRGMRGAKRSGWNCLPYHPYTEYYANFGNYRVSITVPPEYLVGASGSLVGEENLGTEKRLSFVQQGVHDFALVASPDLVRHERIFEPTVEVPLGVYQETMALFGLPHNAIQLKPVTMVFLHPKNQKPNVDRHFQALALGLKELGLLLGAYPYETITMLNPPDSDRGSMGGMEYPALITLGYKRHNPALDYDLENLILHEFAHQYFYGLIASNEFEEAFMDEGFTTYISDKLTEKHYGGMARFVGAFGFQVPVSDWLGLTRLSNVEAYQSSLRSKRFEEPIATPGWAYFTHGSYGFNSYTKTALALNQLERELGWETMAQLLRTYADRYRFGHPSLRDFQNLTEEVTGQSMAWFFDPIFRQVGKVDYEALPIKRYKIRLNEGYMDTPAGPELQDQKTEAENRERQEVQIINNGSLIYPVSIAITFENGEVVTETWDGKSRWWRRYFDDAPKVVKVVADPDGRIVLDARPGNNSYTDLPQKQAQRTLRDRLVFGFQHLLQSIAWGF